MTDTTNALKFSHTSRSFGLLNFQDANGEACSLQESSAMRDERLVWLGCDDIGLRKFTPGEGWTDVPLAQKMHEGGVGHVANNRMHLTQSQVAALLPALAHFAAHGSLPPAEEPRP